MLPRNTYRNDLPKGSSWIDNRAQNVDKDHTEPGANCSVVPGWFTNYAPSCSNKAMLPFLTDLRKKNATTANDNNARPSKMYEYAKM